MNKSLDPGAAVHFSVDDVCLALVQGFDADGQPRHPCMRFVQTVHDELALPVDLYLFLVHRPVQGQVQALACAPMSAWRTWFARRPAVRLGPHGLDRLTAPHRQALPEQRQMLSALDDAITELVGHAGQRASWVRLHEFSEAHEQAPWFLEHGVDTLLTTDKAVAAWRLQGPAAQDLRQRGHTRFAGLNWRSSDLRTEDLLGQAEAALRLQDLAQRARRPIVFTHEYELERAEVRACTWAALKELLKQRRNEPHA